MTFPDCVRHTINILARQQNKTESYKGGGRTTIDAAARFLSVCVFKLQFEGFEQSPFSLRFLTVKCVPYFHLLSLRYFIRRIHVGFYNFLNVFKCVFLFALPIDLRTVCLYVLPKSRILIPQANAVVGVCVITISPIKTKVIFTKTCVPLA